MVEFLLAPSGWGKTTLVYERIRSDIKNKRKVMLIVPDQEAVNAEASCADITADTASTELYVCSFSRLCNDAFRTYGGIAYNYTDKTTGRLLVYLAFRTIAPHLRIYGKLTEADSNAISSVYTTVSELKRRGVAPTELMKASEYTSDDKALLKDKLSDISLIYDAYNANLGSSLSDPDDDMSRFTDLLNEQDIFGRYDAIYIDSFSFFSSMQYKVIEHIFRNCKRVLVSLCGVVDKKDGGFALRCTELTKNKLIRICESEGIAYGFNKLTTPVRFKNKALEALERSLRCDDAPSESDSDCVKTVVCKTMFDEAEYVANEICKAVRCGGKRYRDFNVTVCGAEIWKGVIDATFEKFDIPYFFSSRTDITQKPFVKLIFAAFNVHISGFYREDVISYLKTGLAGVSYNDADIFEAYVKRWRITGKRFHTPVWEMNPHGYSSVFTASERSQLQRINRIKDYVITPLYDFSRALAEKDLTCDKILDIIYDFLIKIDAKKRLEKQIRQCEDEAERSELYQVWHLFFKACGDLSEICKDTHVTASEYASLLAMVLSEVDIGKIPTSQDQVLIGEMGNVRTENPDTVFIMGANEGELPKKASSKTVFSFADVRELNSFGIPLENDEELYVRGSFDFYKSATCSRNAVVMTRAMFDTSNTQKSPSAFFTKIEKLFPKGKEIFNGMQANDACNLKTAVDLYGRLLPTEQSDALKRYLAQNPETEILTREYIQTDSLSDDVAKELFCGDLKLSQSRIGEFKKCKFKYYCSYVLGLKNDDEIDVETNDLGTYVHYILQKLMEMYVSGAITSDISYKELCAHIKQFTDDFTKAYLNADLSQKGYARIRSLFSRIEKRAVKSAQNLLQELSVTEFKPYKLEYRIGDGCETDALRIPLNDGTCALLGGIADRIDTFEHKGVTYIKIVDYKTGKTAFSIEDLQECENIQLFVYMISICSSGYGGFGKNVKPAAVLYVSAMPQIAEHTQDITSDDAENAACASITRSGVSLDDQTVKTALFGDTPSFKPFVGKQVSFITDEEFSKAFDQLRSVISELAVTMKSGRAEAHPQRTSDNKMACDYCDYKAICRYENKAVDDDE